MSTTTRRRSITKTHERISQLGWEPDYFQPADKYPSRYKFPHQGEGPDEAHHAGVPADGAGEGRARLRRPRRRGARGDDEQDRPALDRDHQALHRHDRVRRGRRRPLHVDADRRDPEQRAAQRLPRAVRRRDPPHRACRWRSRAGTRSTCPTRPAGTSGPSALANDVGTRQALNMLSHFIVGDPVQCAFTLQVVAETAFTNIAFVALPDVGARNGDFTLPTTYLSVQSDEARHISNGYATLLTVLQEDDNAPLIERDLAQAWWINHAYLDGFGSAIMEYSSDDRSDPESYMDKWERWIENDWYRSYVLKLGKLGLNFPRRDVRPRARRGSSAAWSTRTCSARRRSGCSTSGARTPLDERDFEWFESKYPGWYARVRAGLGGVPPDAPRPAAVQAPAEHGARAGRAVVLGLPDGLRVPGGHVPPRGRRPHALLLLEGVHVARRVEPRPLRRRPQLLRPLPRLGAVGAGARPRLRARRRRDADRPAAPRRTTGCGRSTT